ncbi:hypothetical protein CYMTET_56964 [Cymbomonas tetramitiformis]|uniref:Uncharacterized protein n=1 Tax=Cymbomonas tetramitiformis TaxID=36881 RepID=A0AAE0BB56_9CHLO|nr:hypothetical protein CYMTET_56964 [Cymbomonas tetramitiformis]
MGHTPAPVNDNQGRGKWWGIDTMELSVGTGPVDARDPEEPAEEDTAPQTAKASARTTILAVRTHRGGKEYLLGPVDPQGEAWVTEEILLTGGVEGIDPSQAEQAAASFHNGEREEQQGQRPKEREPLSGTPTRHAHYWPGVTKLKIDTEPFNPDWDAAPTGRYVASTGTDSTDQAHTPAGEARRRSFEEQEPQLGAIHGFATYWEELGAFEFNLEYTAMDLDRALQEALMSTMAKSPVLGVGIYPAWTRTPAKAYCRRHHTLRNPRPANPEVHSMDMMSDMAAAKTAMDTASQYDVVFEPHPMRKWEIPIMSRRQGWRNAGNEVPKEDRTPEAARTMRQTWRDRGLADITITEYHAANTAWSLDRIKEDSKVRWLKAMERTPMHALQQEGQGQGTHWEDPGRRHLWLRARRNVENPTVDTPESAQDQDQSHQGTEVGEPEENHQEHMLLEEL